MVNLLMSLMVEKEVSSSAVQRVKDTVKPDHLYMIVADEKELDGYKVHGECLLRKEVVRGIYDDSRLDLAGGIALDDKILQYMNLHSTEIMYQQRRFELYPDFPIEPDLQSHYTIYMHNLFFWYNFLQRKQISHVFLSAIPHEGYDCIIYYLCKYLQIPVQITHSCFIPFRRFPLRDFLQDEPALAEEYRKLTEQYKDKGISEIPLEGKTAEIFDRWASLQPDQMKPWYMRTNPFIRRLRQRFYETNLIRLWRGILGEDYVKYGISFSFIKAAFLKIPKLLSMIPVSWTRWRFVRPVKKESIYLRNYYESLAQTPAEGEKYIYFPLQYQPEATSNPMGGDMYSDQIIPLYILSRSLPDDVKIYVKTHPEQLSLMRTKEYYDEIASIPKVRMMKIETSTYELMKNAVAVACLTGTALWECQFFGVPALAFGYSVKNMAPLTYHVRTVDDCRKALERIAENPRKDVTRELKLYTKALHNISFPAEDLGKVLPGLLAELCLGCSE